MFRQQKHLNHHLKKSIGVFDSGFGGLNILKGIIRELPNYNFIYLGDTARSPYGNRSQELIYEFTKQAVDFLFSQNCELIILACNTVSSEALHKIQQEYLPKYYFNKKVLGVLIPAAEEAVLKTKNNRIGVIATEGSVQSQSFVREIRKLNSKIKVWQRACPLLVPIIESGEKNSAVLQIILEKYLQYLQNKNIDTLILGCTHYGILEKQIKEIMGNKIRIISEAKVIPKKLKNYLHRHSEIDNLLSKGGKLIFYSTDLTKKFEILGSKFFGQKIQVQKAFLDSRN